MLQPTSYLAILTYRARAVRGDTERYQALVSSVYVRRDGAWKLAFHQQTQNIRLSQDPTIWSESARSSRAF